MLKVDICGLIHLAREVDIPFWEFEVAVGIRPTIQYPDMELEELKEYNLRAAFQLRHTEESYYAIQIKLIDALEKLAEAAVSIKEVEDVIMSLPTYYIPAGDVVWEKKYQIENSTHLPGHQKLMRTEFAKRDGELSCCDTAEEAFTLATRALFGAYPRRDTHSERAFMRVIELTEDIELLKAVRERSLVWHTSRLASVRKIAALTQYVNRGL
jgi:hypothetical protein